MNSEIWKPIDPTEERWTPKHPAPSDDPIIVDNSRSRGKSVLIVGLPHERNDWVRRLFMEQRPAWNPIVIAPQGSQLRAFVETNFPNACLLIEPERLTEKLLTGTHELGLTEGDLIAALEQVKPPRPSPEAQIAELSASLEKAPPLAAEPWLDPSERGAKRPRGFAKAKGWKAKQRAKRKAQRRARQRARG